MFSLSRLAMLISAFFLGFAASAGAFVGVTYYALNSVSINKIEELTSGAVDIPTEAFLGENPEVDLCDLSLTGAAKEFGTLLSMTEELTLNVLINRYDLILNEDLDKSLPAEARDMPLTALLTSEGREMLLSTLYVGQIQGFECRNPDGTKGKPSDEGTYWFNPRNNEIVTGLNEVLADISIGDFFAGRVSANSVLEGIVIGDILGYKYDEALGYWIDNEGHRATGVMAVFADCTILTVDNKLKTVQIGDLLGYSKNDDGKWCEVSENDVLTPVHGFMNVVAEKTMNNVSGLMDDLTIADIIPEPTGIVAIIPPDTKFNEIGDTINASVSNTPLQFFMNEGLVVFDNATTLDTLAKTIATTNPSKGTLTIITDANPGSQNYDYYHEIWTDNGNGTYTVPTWRTKPLSESFSYIIDMFSNK